MENFKQQEDHQHKPAPETSENTHTQNIKGNHLEENARNEAYSQVSKDHHVTETSVKHREDSPKHTSDLHLPGLTLTNHLEQHKLVNQDSKEKN